MVHVKPKKETIIEDGWYPAEIGEAEERETQFGSRLLVPFEVETGEGIISVDAWWGLPDEGKLAHPKSNVVKFAKQLFGDREFDTDEFSGRSCEVFVEEGEDKDGQPKNFVRKIRPVKEAKQTKKVKANTEGVKIDESDFEDIPF